MKSCLLCLVLLAPLLRAAAPNTLTAEEAAAGWRLLFDGRSLAGWRGFHEPKPGAGWVVQDGALARTGEGGDLLTNDEFGDFEFTFEWRVAEGTNSGVIYRVGLNEAATYRTGPEYQILDNAKGADNQRPSHCAGALYDLVAPPQDFTRPVGAWNAGRIVVRGWHVEHELNGRKIVETDLGSPEGRALIARSKFKHWPLFATLPRGRLALQDHDGVVFFRNLKIREIK